MKDANLFLNPFDDGERICGIERTKPLKILIFFGINDSRGQISFNCQITAKTTAVLRKESAMASLV